MLGAKTGGHGINLEAGQHAGGNAGGHVGGHGINLEAGTTLWHFFYPPVRNPLSKLRLGKNPRAATTRE